MPQEFYVLKCFSCETFQVHIVKKAKKWECKMCGVKQSVKRNYGKGSSKDCRNHVMKLNQLRVTKTNDVSQTEDELCEETWTDDFIQETVKEEAREQKRSVSKWDKYVEENVPDSESETEDSEDISVEIVDKKKKRVKKMPGCYSKNKKICREPSGDELFSKDCEESLELCSTPKNTFCFDKTDQNTNNQHLIQTNNESKTGKYAKYLQDDEDNNDLNQTVNKTSNIFESSLTDLDDILNF